MDLYLERLELVNFKNYTQADLELSPKFNCFAGLNGAGKTSLLDAIYYLSTCKSFLNPADQQNIRHEAPFFVIHGSFHLKGRSEEIHCGFARGQRKQFKRNQKDYQRLAEHIGLIPVVLVSPEDSEIVTGGSEIRRRFMDGIISQAVPSYLNTLIDYNRALAQRNMLLKQFHASGRYDALSLDVWDSRLIPTGDLIRQGRTEFLDEFIPFFSKVYHDLTGDMESPSLSYQSQLSGTDMEHLLSSSREADRSAQYTLKGVHKDDLVLILDGFPVKKFGSQGQQKTFLLSLRLAQFFYLKKKTGVTPVLLLDDIYDKLDDSRTEALLNLVTSREVGQVFLTDTQTDRNSRWLSKMNVPYKIFEISKDDITLYEEKE